MPLAPGIGVEKMAHELDMTGGRANMAFVGEVPWHGLGSQLDPTATFDEWQAAAGMNYNVQRRLVTYNAATAPELQD